MTLRVAIQNIEETTTLVCGVEITDGRPDSGFLTFAFPEGFVYEESADGLIVRCQSNKSLVACQMKLLGGSNDNEKISAIWTTDQRAKGGAGLGPFLHKNHNGPALIASPRCWIHQPPAFQVGTTLGELTWELRMQIAPGAYLLAGVRIDD